MSTLQSGKRHLGPNFQTRCGSIRHPAAALSQQIASSKCEQICPSQFNTLPNPCSQKAVVRPVAGSCKPNTPVVENQGGKKNMRNESETEFSGFGTIRTIKTSMIACCALLDLFNSLSQVPISVAAVLTILSTKTSSNRRGKGLMTKDWPFMQCSDGTMSEMR